MPAILEALAPLGIGHIDMPATPERIWRAIRDSGKVLSRSASLCPEFGQERVTHRVEIEPVGFDHRRGLDDDLVDVADQLELLVGILAVESEPLAEQFHEVDDLEAAPLAGVADLAVTGMVDRRQSRYPRIRHGGQFARYQLAFVLR